MDETRMPVAIRLAAIEDAASVREIYRPYVEETSVSFEIKVPSLEEIEERIQLANSKWAWLMAEIDGRPAGYAYGTVHRSREAYRFSVETSAYVDQQYHRRGIARSLYLDLFRRLELLGYKNAYAGVTLPNDPSLQFHKRMGFEPIGVFPDIGFKFGRWHDVAWLHRPIAPKS